MRAAHVAVVVLQEVKALCKLRVERRELVEVVALAEQLRGDEFGQREVDDDPFEDRLA